MTTKREEREAIEKAMAEYRRVPEIQAPEVAIRKEQTRYHRITESPPSQPSRRGGADGDPLPFPKDGAGREIAESRSRKKQRASLRRWQMNAVQRKEKLTTP